MINITDARYGEVSFFSGKYQKAVLNPKEPNVYVPGPDSVED